MNMALNFDEDTKQRYQQALTAGLDPKESLLRAQQYQHQKNISNLTDQANKFQADSARLGGGTKSGALHYTLTDPESSANITKLAPLAAGAALAPFTGGLSLAGVAGITGLATGGAEIARQNLNQEQTDPLKALKEGILAGGGTYLGGALFNKGASIAGKAIEGTAAGDVANKAGAFLNQDVSKIFSKIVGNNAGNKVIDITDAIRGLKPEEIKVLADSGHLPTPPEWAGLSDVEKKAALTQIYGATNGKTPQLTPGDANTPLQIPGTAGENGTVTSGSQPRVVWNPEKGRAEIIDRGFVAPGASSLPQSPAGVSFQGNPPIESVPSNPAGTPTTLKNPSTGQVTPTQPVATPPGGSFNPQLAQPELPQIAIQNHEPIVPGQLPTNPAEAFNPQATAPIAPLPEKPNIIQKWGDVTRKGVNNPKVKASPTGAAKEDAISAQLDETLGVGSASQKYGRMPAKQAELQNQLEEALSTSETKTDAAKLKASIQKEIETSTTKIGNEGKRYKEEVQKINEIIDRYTDENGMISGSDHYKMSREIAKKAGRAFDKNVPGYQGPDMNEEEKASYLAWKNSRKTLGTNFPEANPILAKEQALIEGAPGLKSGSDKEKEDALKVLGVKLMKVGGAKAIVKDAAGAILQSGGSSLQSGISPAMLLATSKEDSNLLGGGQNTPTTLPTDTSKVFADPTEKYAIKPDEKTVDSTKSTSPFSNPKFIEALVAYDMQKTGGKNLGIIKQLQDLSAAPTLTAAQQLHHDSIQSALTALDAAEQNLITAGGAKGPMGYEAKLPIIGQYLNQGGAAYEDTKIELATQMAKAITGGARPGQEVIQAYLHSLPSISNTPGFAADKLKKLRNDLLIQANSFGYKDLLTPYTGNK